jgi:hypothetical protein
VLNFGTSYLGVKLDQNKTMMLLETTSTISLINNKNKRGPSMEPLRRPALMEFQLE